MSDKNRVQRDGNPFNLGLTLEGEDALEFHRYMENPEAYATPEGKQLIRNAVDIIRRKEMEKWHESGEVSIYVCPACGGVGCCRMDRDEYDGEAIFTCKDCKLKWKIETKLMTRKLIIEEK